MPYTSEKVRCPHCHAPLVAMAESKTECITDHHIGICSECLVIMKFSEDKKPIIITDTELARLPLGTQIYLMMVHMNMTAALEARIKRAALQ